MALRIRHLINIVVSIIILITSYHACLANDENVQSVEVNNDGDITKTAATSLDKDLDPTERLEQKMNILYQQIKELQTKIVRQQETIDDLNSTLTSVVFASDEYGVIYDKTDDRPLLLTSAHAHDVPFVMLNVISVRLPKKDAFYKEDKRKKKKKQKGGVGVTRQSRRGASSRKSRYVHVIVTLSRDGIYQLWDDDQNELHTYFDASILPDSSSEDELINSNQDFLVYSDIITQNKWGNTWFIMARNDASFVKVYTVAAWRDYVNDKVNDRIRKSAMFGKITPENTIYRPSEQQIVVMQKKAKQKKKTKQNYRMSASLSGKQKKNKEKREQEEAQPDVNEFDTEDAANTASTDAAKQCKEGDEECSAKQKQEQNAEKDTEAETKPETGAETQTEREDDADVVKPEEEEEGEEEEETEGEARNATVTGVAVYQQQRKQYIAVSYSDGKLFAFKPNGDLTSSASSMPFQSPNKTIVAIATTAKKYELLVVTEAGFRFLKLPRLSKTGPFCQFSAPTTVNSVAFDATTTSTMYLGTTDGRLLIYNTKKLNKKMCRGVDSFTIHPDSAIQVETLPGYLLLTSSLGLHAYNVTAVKGAPYSRPGLLFVRRFEDEFEFNDPRLSTSNVLFSSYTDQLHRTVLAYAQSATNVPMNRGEGGEQETDTEDVKYRFVVMESYLPSFDPNKNERGGIMGMVSKAPLFVGIAMFAFFWVFFKGKSGGAAFGNSPIGRIGKMFGGRGRRGAARSAGSRDVGDKMNRWRDRHPGATGGAAGSARKPSANMRYAQQQRGSSGLSGKGYRNTLGKTNWS